jgi:hypothetical protein
VVIANQIMQPMVATSGNMVVPRFGHSSTLLQDGRVLIAGGQSKAEDSIFPNQSTYLSSLEIFDPVTETFTLSNATLTSPRSNQAAVLMGNGQVLFIGGGASADMETYDPVTDVCTWRNTIGGILLSGTIAYDIGNNQVLIYGRNNVWLTEAIIINTSSWTELPISFYTPLYTAVSQASCILQDGRIMVSGGSPVGPPNFDPDGAAIFTAGVSQNVISIFDPATQQFTVVGHMLQARTGHTMLDLGNGTVEIYGGYLDTPGVQTGSVTFIPGPVTPLSSVEIFNYASTVSSIPLNTSIHIGNLIGGKYYMNSAIRKNILNSGT